MEWKAILFKKFWNIDAIPLMIDTQDSDEIIKIIECIAPSFWWINLEDIAAPKCFYIESELKKRLNIPVFHDDQHWTAIVVLAGIINALKLKNEKIEDQKIIISWAWAAALAIGKLLHKAWAKNIIFSDSKGILSSTRSDLNEYKKEVVPYNKNDISWTLKDAIKDANIFIWVSKWNLLKANDIKTMADKPTVFALANPTPEITPEEAKKWWAYIIATWRWDYPNQVNNVLVFPWIFRWALDAHISQITDEHKLIAAHTLAECIKDIDTDNIIPNALQEGIAEKIAKAIANS
jgi:malate dehydrogenase (oxaloacetate-decarboxylating)